MADETIEPSSVGGNLRTARLTTSVEVYDWVTGTTFDVDVVLTWQGTGDLWSSKSRYKADGPGVKHRSRSNGKERFADFSGTIAVPAATGSPSEWSGPGLLSQRQEGSNTVEQKSRPSAPVIAHFDAFPSTIYEGHPAELYWWVSGTEPLELRIDQGVGAVSGMGYVTVWPEVTTTYTLTASNERGSDSAEVTVFVVPPLEPPTPDVFEPNDTPETATPITLDFSSRELSITWEDVDWFTFTLEEVATVAAGIEAWLIGSPLDAVMALFDADLGLIEFNDAAGGLDPHLEVHLGAGLYYLAVSGWPDYEFMGGHWQHGLYYLTVTSTP